MQQFTFLKRTPKQLSVLSALKHTQQKRTTLKRNTETAIKR
jgi:hypothetical protein